MAQARKRAAKAKRASAPKHLSTPYKAKWVPLRVTPHEHTGKKLPFYCTSYAALYFLLIFTTLMVLMTNHYVSAISGDGTISLGGTVTGKPPEIAASITQPSSGQKVSDSQLTISGSCLQDNYIEAYRNDVYAGMSICDQQGRFSITIALVPGENNIFIRTRDALGQYGPNSKSIKVFFTQSAKSTDPLVIYTDPTQIQIPLKESLNLKYKILGGTPPYSITANWGDGGPDDLLTKNEAGDYSINHVFAKAGTLTVRLNAIDSQASTSSVQTVIIVNPAPNAEALSVGACSETGSGASSNFDDLKNSCTAAIGTSIVDRVLPVVAGAGLLTASFWLGEQVIYHQALQSRFHLGRH